jgi:hypothetical protein
VAFVYHGGGLSKLVTRWYLGLAQGGYVYPNYFPDGRIRASNLAYFPLFPCLVRHLGDLGVFSLSQRCC